MIIGVIGICFLIAISGLLVAVNIEGDKFIGRTYKDVFF